MNSASPASDFPSLQHRFSFPLNVYARLLELEYGQAHYLHYGLFEEGQASAELAQQQASDLLWQHLPAPCKLLDVGLGLGTTLRRLTDAGYAATGITPDEAQIAYVRSRHGGTLDARPCRLEDFRDAPGQWQAMLFQESAQYIDGIDLFECADRLLEPDGEIIVMDEFLQRRDREDVSGLHLLDHFLRLAERAGFAVTAHEDISRLAAPTTDWLLAGTARHRETLKRELGVSDAQLDDLDTSNRAYRQKYSDGRYGYHLLRLKRAKRPDWKLGRIVGDRATEMRALFADVFGHEMSVAHWQWKYGDGRGLGIGVWKTSDDTVSGAASRKLVAHYGGMSRDILYFGRPARALQCCDVMVADAGRGSLSRQGPVFLCIATCLEHDIGYGTAHLVGFGFPTERAYRLPERLGLYARTGKMVEVHWPAMPSRPAVRLKLRELNPADPRSDDMMNACWSAMRADLGDCIAGVRDAGHVRHRYLAHPDKTYRLFVLQRRFGGEPLGVLVLRLDESGGVRRCEVLDVIGAVRWIPLLIRQARRIAAQWACPSLFAWMTDNLLPHFGLPPEATMQETAVLVPGNCWTAGPSIESQAGRWWLMGGDTDFR